MDKTKLRHVVLLGFKDGTTEGEIDAIVRRFAALADVVPGIEAFESGVDNSPEGIARGHTHCFFLTFPSEAARDAYLPHPAHQDFVSFASEWIENALVIDYWAQEAKKPA
ncbi:MAG: Dabb family protein [Bauldia sp.]|nr:Dabb family protein [Bauldia sp.]